MLVTSETGRLFGPGLRWQSRHQLEVLEKVSEKAHLTVVLGEKGLADRVVKLV